MYPTMFSSYKNQVMWGGIDGGYLSEDPPTSQEVTDVWRLATSDLWSVRAARNFHWMPTLMGTCHGSTSTTVESFCWSSRPFFQMRSSSRVESFSWNDVVQFKSSPQCASMCCSLFVNFVPLCFNCSVVHAPSGEEHLCNPFH